jgi:glyoxylase-like metal-dependent hydrolase (beta-lactamase superfamily II)
MFVLEALRAKHGDALLLHYGTPAKPKLAVIDGGPGGVYADAVRPRLTEIRAERGLADDEPLDIELMMVSHLDADHITGLLELMRKLRDLEQARKPLPWRIARFWHNAFDDLTGGKAGGAAVASTNAALQTASAGDPTFPQIEGSSLVLASVGQGRELRDLVKFFDLDGNPPFKGIVKEPHAPIKLDGLELTVIGPDEANLAKLQKDWNTKVKELLAKKSKSAKAELAAYVDESVYNLSSIVVLAKAGGKTMLLTGDARGDFTLTALRRAKLLDDGKPLKVDLLKLPHHGSDRNVRQDYFDNIRAKHYVISANGRDTNPDVPTLEMISKSRKDDDFTIWLANAPGDFVDEGVGDEVAKFFAADQKKRKYGLEFRDSDALGVRIELA